MINFYLNSHLKSTTLQRQPMTVFATETKKAPQKPVRGLFNAFCCILGVIAFQRCTKNITERRT